MSQPFMQLYVGDYIRDTMDLSTEEHGAYLLLLMTMWSHDARLPNDHKKLARIARLSPAKFRLAWETLERFFTVEGEHITQNRLKNEHEKAQEKGQKRAEAGAKGGASKALKYKERCLASATDLPKHLPEPEPEEKRETNVSLQKRAERAKAPEGFEDFWQAYPHRNGVKRGRQKAEQKFRTAVRSGVKPDALVDAANRYRQDRQVIDGYAKDPATWINGKCWEDEIDRPENVSPINRRPEPGERRVINGVQKVYINHFEGWMREYG